MDDEFVYPPRRVFGRQTAFVTACEALTWIAWGEPQTIDAINDAGFNSVMRWGTSELDMALAALDARAAPEPYCAIRRHITGFANERRYLERSVSPEGPETLRAMRARERRRTGRLVSYAELAAELRAEIANNRRCQALLDRATGDLIEALRAEKITAYGQRHRPNGCQTASKSFQVTASKSFQLVRLISAVFHAV